MPAPEPLDVRFARKVDRNGPIPAHCPELGPCHVWTGAKDPKGYGRVNFKGKAILSHRVALFLHHGSWPTLHALHRCDNPSCVNPDHLFEGTDADNMYDKVAKNRQAKGLNVGARGEQHGCAKLTEQQVRDIRANYALCRVTQKELGDRYGVHTSTVSLIIRGKHWANA